MQRGGGRGRGRGRMAPGLRPVDEGVRISIADALDDFRASDAKGIEWWWGGGDLRARAGAACRRRSPSSFRRPPLPSPSPPDITFPPDMSNHDRAVVHAECRKHGLRSKSHGKGAARAVTVYKPKDRSRAAGPYALPLAPASRAALAAYFGAHPPTAAEAADAGDPAAGDAAGAGAAAGPGDAGRGGRGDGGRGAASFPADEVARRRDATARARSDPRAAHLAASRAALPIADYEATILQALETHQVVLVAGETGCGKTTQVPQFLVDAAWAAGKGARVVCTQPRRLSATSVADRVATERGQRPGGDVGYAVRLETAGGPDASLLFCTNGVLLRQLTHGDGLRGVTHVVCDEIHERDRFADFLLILLRDLLPAHPHVRLVLMSATLHVDLFAGYFGGCPVVAVPGRAHPVTSLYLEDALALVGWTARHAAAAGRRGGGGGGGGSACARARPLPPGTDAAAVAAVQGAIYDAFVEADDDAFYRLLDLTGAGVGGEANPLVDVAHPDTGATALHAAAGKGRLDDVATLLVNGAAAGAGARDGSTPADWARRFGHAAVAEFLDTHVAATASLAEDASVSEALAAYQAGVDADDVDLALIEGLLAYVCGEGRFGLDRATPGGPLADAGFSSGLGAVLVFLPGWDEISRLKERLESSPAFPRARHTILPLHSMVPPADQRRVFARPPHGVRKIVLATNIAETAVTIDDVVVVINSGRHKEKSYDPYTGVSTLQAGWAPRASERQRAGRCRPGVAFHLYSKARAQSLPEFAAPELQRSPLDELCLQVKLLSERGFSGAASVAGFLARAAEPPPPAAVANALGLLEAIGALTPDEKLTTLGRHLAALPLAPAVGKLILFGALYRCLDPLLTIACCLAYRDPWVLPIDPGARKAATAARAGLAARAGGASDHLALAAAYDMWASARSAGGGRDRQVCRDAFLSPGTMAMVDGMRGQLVAELKARRLIPSLAAASASARDAGLVRAVLAAGLYPRVGRVLPPPADGGARKGAAVATRKDDKVRVHPSSVNGGLAPPPPPPGSFGPAPLVVYDEVTRSEATLVMRQTTCVGAHAILLTAEGVTRAEPGTSGLPDDDNNNGRPGEDDEDEEPNPLADGVPVVVIDGWLPLRVPIGADVPLLVLRRRLAACFAEAVARPGAGLEPELAGALACAAAVFSAEAGGGGGGGGGHGHGGPPVARGFGYGAPRGGGGGGGPRGGGGGAFRGDRRSPPLHARPRADGHGHLHQPQPHHPGRGGGGRGRGQGRGGGGRGGGRAQPQPY